MWVWGEKLRVEGFSGWNLQKSWKITEFANIFHNQGSYSKPDLIFLTFFEAFLPWQVLDIFPEIPDEMNDFPWQKCFPCRLREAQKFMKITILEPKKYKCKVCCGLREAQKNSEFHHSWTKKYKCKVCVARSAKNFRILLFLNLKNITF